MWTCLIGKLYFLTEKANADAAVVSFSDSYNILDFRACLGKKLNIFALRRIKLLVTQHCYFHKYITYYTPYQTGCTDIQ